MLPASSSTVDAPVDVLFVDTEVATATYGPTLCEKYRVHTASTTAAALAQLARHTPALVIMELTLGGHSILEICRQAKASPMPSTVLATTADVAHVPDALVAGCDGVLLKPFATNLLHARIGRLLRGRVAEVDLNGDRMTVERRGTNHAWPQLQCPHCQRQGVTSFEFSSHRRSWFACLQCKHAWIGKRQE